MDEQCFATNSSSADTPRQMDVSLGEQTKSSLCPQQAMSVAARFRGIKNILCTSAFATLLLAGLAAYGVSRYGSFGALVAAVQGHVLYVEPQRLPLGNLKPRQRITVRVRLRSLASQPIKVLGSHSIPSCGCLGAGELPVELTSYEVKEVPINLTVPASGRAGFEIAVTFYTNVAGEQPSVVLYGQVLPIETRGNSDSNPG